MTHIRVKGFQIFEDRLGKKRCYHRATKTAVDLVKNPIGSAGFIAECDRITRLSNSGLDAKPGTLGLLITRYRAHSAFQELAPRTREDYQRKFDYLRPLADTPLSRFNSPMIVRIRDHAAETRGRRFGNYVKSVLSLLFAWGKERGYVKENPATGIKGIRKPRGQADANRPWTDLERRAVMDALPPHMIVPMALMMYCGLDPQDALALPRSAISEGKIDTKRGKTGVAVWMPMPTQLVVALRNAPKHDALTVCATSLGRPWTGSGFRSSWTKIKKRLEVDNQIGGGLTLKGLRHTVATILAEMGYDAEAIKNMLGQKTDAMARHYSSRADRSKTMTATVHAFDAELDRRNRNMSNLDD